MELHQLFSAAVEDLPEMTDVLPEVERSVRRRSALNRLGAAAATTALVLGVGTLTIAAPWSRPPQPPTQASVGVGAPSGDFPQQEVSLLQAAWPVEGATISCDPADAGFAAKTSAAYDDYSKKLTYKVVSATGTYGLQLRFVPDKKPVSAFPVRVFVYSNVGVADLEDGSNAVATIILMGQGGRHVDETQLRQFASPDMMRTLYRLATADGMLLTPNPTETAAP